MSDDTGELPKPPQIELRCDTCGRDANQSGPCRCGAYYGAMLAALVLFGVGGNIACLLSFCGK